MQIITPTSWRGCGATSVRYSLVIASEAKQSRGDK